MEVAVGGRSEESRTYPQGLRRHIAGWQQMWAYDLARRIPSISISTYLRIYSVCMLPSVQPHNDRPDKRFL